jgi:RNA polymerase sigma-70 factor (ECF subfamily)
MTTAPDLPIGVPTGLPATHPALSPPPLVQPRPPLAVVPEPDADHEVVDFDEALRRAAPRLHRYARRRLHDDHEAEEVVQEALLRAFQHRATLPTEDDLMAWLTVVTGRLVIDRLRVRGRSTPVAELPPGSRAARDTAEVVVARDEARIALDALEAMPSRQAAVLWAREVEGLSYDDIGDRFRLSEPTVRSLLHRARRTLRKEYADRGGTLPGVGLVALAPWLRGLRAASRVRDLARRGATAAALGATGLAVVSVVPFHSTHAPRAAPATTPSISMRVATHVPTTHQRKTVVAAARHTATPTDTTRPSGPTFAPARLPHACGHGVRIGCDAPSDPILYVGLPVPVLDQRWIGVSTDKVSCDSLPSTPVAQCAPAPTQEP